MRKLDVGQHIVVGTPGRVFDMISRKVLRPNDIKQFVLDEADEMLSRGFKDQIYDVFRHLNQEIQVKYSFCDCIAIDCPAFISKKNWMIKTL